VFGISRVVLHLGLSPYFDPDTYKYLHGADTLWHGDGLPSTFGDLPTTGGGLHSVPGYAYFLDGIWTIRGRVTMLGITAAQAIVAFIAFVAAADVARRLVGPWTGLAVFSALTLAPPVAWLEHTVMPDALTPYLLLVAAWLALVVSSPTAGPGRDTLGAAGCGLLVGGVILSRTASQVFVPIPIALVLRRQRSPWAMGRWTATFALAALAPLVPWMLRNGEIHGIYRLTASSGRNLYFSALWTDTIDREARMRELDMRGEPDVLSSFGISNRTVQQLVDSGMSLGDADAAMRTKALEAYRAAPLGRVLRDRISVVRGLFAPASDVGVMLQPLRPFADQYILNRLYWLVRAWSDFERNPFSPEVISAMHAAAPSNPAAESAVHLWIRWATLDGVPLLAIYVASLLVVLFLLPRERWPVFWAFAASPVLYLAMFTLVGVPLYRYQVALHPFMLATIAVALSTLASEARRTRRVRR
jgi:4-amino-4-deoxy-L-arabinose transferase-like glycosyltransferase